MNCVKEAHSRPATPQMKPAVSTDPIIIPANKHNKAAQQPSWPLAHCLLPIVSRHNVGAIATDRETHTETTRCNICRNEDRRMASLELA